jgi:hypothetical protein
MVYGKINAKLCCPISQLAMTAIRVSTNLLHPLVHSVLIEARTLQSEKPRTNLPHHIVPSSMILPSHTKSKSTLLLKAVQMRTSSTVLPVAAFSFDLSCLKLVHIILRSPPNSLMHVSMGGK